MHAQIHKNGGLIAGRGMCQALRKGIYQEQAVEEVAYYTVLTTILSSFTGVTLRQIMYHEYIKEHSVFFSEKC